MKKLVFLTVLFALAWFVGVAYTADAPGRAMREIISQNQPDEISALIQNTPLAGKLDQAPFSAAGTDVYNYGIVRFVSQKQYDEKIEAYSQGKWQWAPDVISLFALIPVKDAKGNVTGYESKFIGIVFYNANVSWFRNQEEKALFYKALKELFG